MEFKYTLTGNQIIIYDTVKKYLNRHPHFTIYELFLHCKRVTNVPDKEIMDIIEKFISKKIIVEGSKLTRDNILQKSKVRYNLYNYILRNPGMNFSKLIKKFDIGPHAGRWHIEMLKKFGFIRERKYMVYNLYYDQDFPQDKEIIIFILRNETAFKIYLTLKNNILKTSTISKILDKSTPSIEYHLKKMVDNDLIVKNYDNTYSINLDNLYFIGKYLNLDINPQLQGKINTQLEKKKSIEKEQILPVSKTKIKALREYDYVGGNIHFKVAVQNNSALTISKINVLLSSSPQFNVKENLKEIEFLVPGESRGVDFILEPNTCGKSQVYATISYSDATGQPKSLVIEPKEIWIKCPLVQPKGVTEKELEEWKKTLKKGTHIIEVNGLNSEKLFEIAYNQISTLDLTQIIYDKKNLHTIFSGVAKVTGTKIIVEVKIFLEKRIIINIWANNLKQATGFLSYIKNLINLSIKNAKKIQLKAENFGQNIINIFELGDRIIKLFNYCNDLWVISDILIILKEIKSRVDRFFPDLEINDEILNLIELIEGNFMVGDNIDEKASHNIQIKILKWLDNIQDLLKSNVDIFCDTFQEEKEQCNLIINIKQKLTKTINEIKEKITQGLLSYLIIMEKDSGCPIYTYNFGKSNIDGDLISGFLSAIQHFGSEIISNEHSRVENSIKKIKYQGFEINLDNGKYIRVALILKGSSNSKLINEKLVNFIKSYENKFQSELKNWNGDISHFKNSIKIINNSFKLDTRKDLINKEEIEVNENVREYTPIRLG
ncbi:MAG: hypothetical protein ACTSPY_15805 [Candidatus Helarchaeota archaeon]